MPIEVATYLNELNSAYPDLNDDVEDGDDHLRLLKAVLKATFPNISGIVHPTQAQLNYLRYVDTTNIPVLATNVAALAAGPFSGAHIALGGGQIQAKSNTSAATLELNKLGGSVNIGPQAGSGSVSLYNSAGRAAFTETNGFAIRDNGGSVPTLNLYSSANTVLAQLIQSGGLYLQNLVNSSSFLVTGRNASSATKIILVGSPISGVTLYYAGTPAISTTNIGARNYPASGNDVYQEFFRADLTTRNGYIGFVSTGLEIRQEVANQATTLSGVITGGTVKTLLTALPTGALGLYFAGVSKLVTSAYGVVVGSNENVSPDASGTGQIGINGNGYTGYLTLDGTGMYLGHNSGARLFAIRVDEANYITVNPAGSVDLAYNAVKAVETVDPATYGTGARIKAASGALIPIGFNGMPPISVGVSTALRVANIGHWLRSSAGITLDSTTNSAFDGASWAVENTSGGAITITPTGVTLVQLDGVAGASGTFNVAPFGYAVITKMETGVYRIVGVGLSV